jgi:two-component system, chemotaxis family, response regulator Rcp1
MIQGLEARKAHILLLEDNPGDVDLLRRALRSAELDCELTVLEDGAEALAFVRQQGKYASASTPDLAVLDLNLPKNDGLEVLEAMRASPLFAAVPVAILSSSASPHEQAKLQAFRIGRFITKPPRLRRVLENRVHLEIIVGRKQVSR